MAHTQNKNMLFYSGQLCSDYNSFVTSLGKLVAVFVKQKKPCKIAKALYKLAMKFKEKGNYEAQKVSNLGLRGKRLKSFKTCM